MISREEERTRHDCGKEREKEISVFPRSPHIFLGKIWRATSFSSLLPMVYERTRNGEGEQAPKTERRRNCSESRSSHRSVPLWKRKKTLSSLGCTIWNHERRRNALYVTLLRWNPNSNVSRPEMRGRPYTMSGKKSRKKRFARTARPISPTVSHP